MEIIEKTKKHLIESIEKLGGDEEKVTTHVSLVEKWALKILEKEKESNKEVVILSVWLHDIGRIVGDKNVDHSVNSEVEAKRFLTGEKVDEKIIEQVCHSVRAHRCRDVLPNTTEAKILAVADSASHMEDTIYIEIAMRGDLEKAKSKLEKDYNDVGLLPEIQIEIKSLYEAWKNLLNEFSNN